MAQTKNAALLAKKKTAASKTKAAKKAAPKKKTATKAKTATKKKAPARSTKAKASKAATATKSKAKASKTKPEIGEEEVKLDRRRAAERRDEEAAAPSEVASNEPKLERREKVSRRRQIDPTTCERDYSDAEVEFMNALDAYKRTSGRMFPTCSEVLEVIRGMGYTQLSPVEVAMIRESRGENDPEPSLEDNAEADAELALAESDDLRVD